MAGGVAHLQAVPLLGVDGRRLVGGDPEEAPVLVRRAGVSGGGGGMEERLQMGINHLAKVLIGGLSQYIYIYVE